jgi:TatD DNase family protein
VVARARAAGIERLLVPGFDLASSRDAVALAVELPDLVRAAVGIHPHYAAAAADAAWAELEELAAAPGVVAVGEIGLDYFRNLSAPEAQRDAFARQLDLAARHELPVIVHDRDAHADVLAALTGWGGSGRAAGAPRGVLHAFSGDAAMARAAVDAGFLCSFALPVAFRSAAGPRAAAVDLPEGGFLVETDAPWLAPAGAGQRNEPTTVLRVAAELAALRGSSPEQVAASARAAFDRLVGG